MIATALVLLTLTAPAPARIQVGADEFGYTLSRATIKAGPAIVQLANYGEDEHDLRLRRIGGTRIYRVGTVAPGRVKELEARFLARPLPALVLPGRPPGSGHARHPARQEGLTARERQATTP